MNKRKYILLMIFWIIMIVICLTSAIIGLIFPKTTTPWFWFVMTAIYATWMVLEYVRYKKQ